MVKVSDLSEKEILARMVPLLPRGNFTELGSGDDCAIVTAPGNHFAVTTDILVEDVHFRRDWSTGAEVGARAAAQNLSDIAAMGASPTALVVSIVVPPDLEMAWLEDFAGGMGAEVHATGAGVVGGDLSRGPVLVISVTAHGRLGGRAVTRSGARPGDTLAVVGNLGQSAAGLAALTTGTVFPGLRGAEVPTPFTLPVQLYRSPQPPLEAGPLAAQRGATAMMDLSDGLVIDATRLAEASDVTIDLTRYGLQDDCGILEDAGRELGMDPLQWVLFGGEDHGLLVTFPPYVLVTEPFRAIGTIGRIDDWTAKNNGSRVTMDGRPLSGGFDHFAPSP